MKTKTDGRQERAESQFHARHQPGVLQQVKAAAEEDGFSVNRVHQLAIEAWLKARQAKRGKVQG